MNSFAYLLFFFLWWLKFYTLGSTFVHSHTEKSTILKSFNWLNFFQMLENYELVKKNKHHKQMKHSWKLNQISTVQFFKKFLKMFSRKSALNIFTTLQPSETIRACIFQFIGFYIEYTTIQPLWSIYYNIQISNNFFFVNTFLWCKQHQLDLVEIPVMLAKSGCDDTSDKWCWEGNRDWTLVWGGGRVEWTCKWLVSARNYSSISSQVI